MHGAHAQSVFPPPPDLVLHPVSSSDTGSIGSVDSWRRGSIFIESVLIALQGAMQQRESPAKQFITRDSLVQIWTNDRLLQLVEVHHPFHISDIDIVRSSFIQTLSILVEIRWSEWSRFREIFLEHRNPRGERDRTDRNIPGYTSHKLEADDFLGSWASMFFRNQFMFCPVDIEEGMSLTMSSEWRLPFLDEGSKSIANGGYGRVTKEVVATGHLRLSSGRRPDQNAFACKRFTSRGHFDREARNLRKLKDSLAQHDRILPFFATITIGTEFNLLFQLADMDLETFLGRNTQNIYFEDLISESTNLAGALGFLHERLDPPLLFCHMDLKPANILVFYDSENSTVGKWKISDFGISIFAVPDGLSEMNGRGNTFTPSPIQGTYQSPEVCYGSRFGRKSDVWSFGCVLVQILAFGLDGAHGLKALDQERRRQEDGTEYHNDYFHRELPSVLNPQVEKWLNALPRRRYPDFLARACREFRELLLWALEIDINKRPTAMQVRDELEKINLIFTRDGLTPCPAPERPPTPVSPTSTPEKRIPASVLVNAIRHNDCNDLEHILSLATPADAEGLVDGERSLIHAINLNSSRAVNILLTSKPDLDVEERSQRGSPPLFLAAENGNEEIVSRLLQAGVSVDATSTDGLTPLMIAVRHGHEEIVRRLLEMHADWTISSRSGYNSLHYITWSPSGDSLTRLFTSVGRVSNFNVTQHPNGETPFISLVKNFESTHAWKETFRAFIEAGADINLADRQKMTPLDHAVELNHPDLVYGLVRRNAQLGNTTRPSEVTNRMRLALNGINPQSRKTSFSIFSKNR